MKGYIISFCMVLAALLLSTLSFLVNNSTYMTIHSLPGIALAAIVLWRLHQVRQKPETLYVQRLAEEKKAQEEREEQKEK